MVISSEGLDCCGRGVIFFLHSGTITVKDLGRGEGGGGREGREEGGRGERGGREVYRREREKGNRYELRYMYMHTTQA